MTENLTSLPLITAHIGTSNSTAVLASFIQPIDNAIQKSAPGGTVSSLTLDVSTRNNTGMWSLSENYSMVVIGANENSGSNVASNLSFLSMNVTGPIEVGTLELNQVGSTLLLPALQAKVALYSNIKYYIDGSNPTTSFIPEQTTRVFSLLDFTWVAPIWTWTLDNNILGQSTNWTLTPTGPQYNLTIGVPSPEGPLIKAFTAVSNTSMNISVPANAWVKGNTVYFDTPSPAENLMPVIILGSVTVAILALVLDRRLTVSLRARKKR